VTMKAFVLILVALAFILGPIMFGCGPLNNPQSAEYPCGPRGISCATHMCCWENEECGDSATCPAGMCCYVGPTDNGILDEKKRPHAQTHVP